MNSKVQLPPRLEKIFNLIYRDGQFTSFGLELCSEASIDSKGLIPKDLKEFEKRGQSEEMTRMTYVHYEERRQLKLAMLDDLNERIKISKKRKVGENKRINKLTFINAPSIQKMATHKNSNKSHVRIESRRKGSIFIKDPHEETGISNLYYHIEITSERAGSQYEDIRSKSVNQDFRKQTRAGVFLTNSMMEDPEYSSS